MVVEDANTLTLRFAPQLMTLCCLRKEADISELGLILACLTIDKLVMSLKNSFSISDLAAAWRLVFFTMWVGASAIVGIGCRGGSSLTSYNARCRISR